MPIFQSKSGSLFYQAAWEQNLLEGNQPKSFLESADEASNQFILLQLSDGDKRVLNTTEVVPQTTGHGKTRHQYAAGL